MKQALNAVLGMLAVLLSLITLLSLIPAINFILDLFSHFRLQYFIAAGIGFLIAMALWNKKLMVVGLILMIINGYFVVPWYLSEAGGNLSGSTNYTLLTANVLSTNLQYELLHDEVKKHRPDIIVLLEYTDSWDENLIDIQELYPHRVLYPGKGNFGMAIYSKFEVKTFRTFSDLDLEVINIHAKLAIDGKEVDLLAIHPPPPVNPLLFRLRNKVYSEAAKIVNSVNDQPLIVAGDFNSSMWSASYNRLIKQTGLKNARAGYGISSTWPSEIGRLGIPIDHCLYKHLTINNSFVTKTIGSDHRPLYVEFSLD